MILDYLNDISVEQYQPRNASFEPTNRPANTSVDWLRCTTTKIKNFHDFVSKFTPMLKGHGFTFVEKNKGILGYTHCWMIQFKGEICGNICADALDKMGGMFEMTGTGCQLLQSRWDLWCYLNAGLSDHGFGITRLDVAADFKGEIWDDFGVNMLDIVKRVRGGIHKVPRGRMPSTNLIGDWLDIVADGYTAEEYIPKEQCLGGLTLNVGSGSSVNKWVWYEKGKQLAGKNPEMYDGSLHSWIRLERRFGRGSGDSKVVIPFDFAVCPDEAFVYNCEGVESFVNEWLEFKRFHGVEVVEVPKQGIDLDRVGLLKKTSLKRTALHVANQSARFFRSLVMLGIDPMDFVDKVISDEPNRGFDPVFHSGFDLDKCLGASYA